MIISKIQGGLGNQMFNYAFGRYTSQRLGADFKLDIAFHQTYFRPYMLDCFKLQQNLATKEETFMLRDGINLSLPGTLSFKLRRRFAPYYKKPHVIQQAYHFDPNYLKISNNSYLSGTWQSEKFFKETRSLLIDDFQFKNEPDPVNKVFLEKIGSVNSISIHNRRGDFLGETGARDNQIVMNMDYYMEGLEVICREISDPHIFVFSDEPEWARVNLIFPYPTHYIDHNQAIEKNTEDLRLLSACKHHIISTSTFCWWGAWLSRFPGKIVVSPKRWFSKEDIDTKDVVPESWIRL